MKSTWPNQKQTCSHFSKNTVQLILIGQQDIDKINQMNQITQKLKFLFSAKDTCLKQLHVNNKGKIVDFAGYNLPVYYSKGIIKEHLHCRQSSSIFDVSHMGQITITGPDRIKLLQLSTVGSTNRKSKGSMHECYLTMFLNENAGIIDDAIATNLESEGVVRIVVNGANKYIDMAHLEQVISKFNLKVDLKLHDDNGLIALQGPKSAGILQQLFTSVNLSEVPFMTQFNANFENSQYTVTRSGYTGEDGFQIASNASNVVKITEALLSKPGVELAGLGSRDSLRLEAGLCLHGHDILPTITPLEGTLMWTVYKRKPEDTRLHFIGEDVLKKLQEDVKNKTKSIRKRVGFIVNEPGVVREHCKIFTKEGKQIGETTSGTHSPSIKKSLGMAYVDQDFTKDGTEIFAEQRGKRLSMTISKMPFLNSNYYKGWGK